MSQKKKNINKTMFFFFPTRYVYSFTYARVRCKNRVTISILSLVLLVSPAAVLTRTVSVSPRFPTRSTVRRRSFRRVPSWQQSTNRFTCRFAVTNDGKFSSLALRPYRQQYALLLTYFCPPLLLSN